MKFARHARRIRRHVEIALAALRAFRYRVSIGAPILLEGLSLGRRVLRLGRSTRTKPREWRFRLRQCRSCPIFYAPHGTCGDNGAGGDPYLRNLDQETAHLPREEQSYTIYPRGCSCICGVKSSDLSAVCTLQTFGLASRWSRLGFSLDEPTSAVQPDAQVKHGPTS